MKDYAIRIIEDFEKTHNHSWFKEILIRNKRTLNDIALYYRGNTVSYAAMFRKMKQ